jgi:hypothetical protein
MMEGHRTFADILDECLDRVLMGESVEACIAEYPEHADELRESLMTAGALHRTAFAIRPDLDKKRASRQRFLEALDKRRNARPWWQAAGLGALLGTWPRGGAPAAGGGVGGVVRPPPPPGLLKKEAAGHGKKC